MSKPQCPEAPAGLIPEMPLPLPVIPSQDLQIQAQFGAAASRGICRGNGKGKDVKM